MITIRRGGPAGYDGGKKSSGRKRHLLADTMGLVLKAKVHAADMADRGGAKPLLEPVSRMFSRLSHCWVDMGYRGNVIDLIEQKLGWTVDVVKRQASGDVIHMKLYFRLAVGFWLYPPIWLRRSELEL